MRAHDHPEGTYTGDYGPDGRARLHYTPEPGASAEAVPILARHSPNGVAWGYTGNGAADCARSILAHATTDHLAETHYQDFKREVVAGLPVNEPFRLDPEILRRWLVDTGIASRPGRPLHAVAARHPDWDAQPAFSHAHAHGDDDHARDRQLDARARELADWERRLDQRERRLDKRAAALDDITDVAPAWTAPAEPIRTQIEWYVQATGDDIATLAKGLDLEPDWVAGVLDGDIKEVDLDHIQRMCETLHCNPFDLWGSHVGRSLLHAYGPELWPCDTQALTRGYRDPDSPPPGPHLPPPEPPTLGP